MVSWYDPALQARLGMVDVDIIFLLLGLYGWEYLSSLDVEYAVVRGRLAFRWPLIPYLLGRVFLFIFLLLNALRANPPSDNFLCLPFIRFTTIAGDIGLGCASTNFMIRTWVIWKDSRLVHIFLSIITLGHWIALALDVTNLRTTRKHGACGVVPEHSALNAAVFVYTLCYDTLVLVLSIVGLSRQSSSSKSPLTKRLRAQGFVYFVVAVVAYIPPSVFSLLGVNVMESITGVPATTACVIASSRAVRSLLGLRMPNSSQASEEDDENEVALTSHIPVQSTPTTIC